MNKKKLQLSNQTVFSFSKYYDQLPTPILLLDESWMIIYMNGHAANIFRMANQEWSGSSILSWVDPLDRPLFIQNLHSLDANSELTVHFKSRMVVREEHILWIEISAQRMKDNDRSYIALSLHDMTKQFWLDTISEYSTDAIHVVTPEGKSQYCIHSLTNWMGYSEEEYRGKSIFESIEPQDRPSVEQIFHQLIRNQTSAEAEFQAINKEGHIIDVHAKAKPVIRNGKVENVVIVARDITKQKITERMLEESEQKFRSLFDHNPDGIYSMDLRGKITGCNTALENITGYSMEELNQYESYIPLIASDYLESTRRFFEKAARGEAQNYETVGIHKNGQGVHYHITNIPIIVEGKVIGVYGIAKNISDKKKASITLQQTSERLQALIDYSADSISVADLNGKILQVNPAFQSIFGWEAEEVIGRFSPIIPEFLQMEFFEILEKIKAGEEIRGLESVRKKKDGTLIDVSSTYSPIWDGQGHVVAISSIVRDISDRKKTEELLRRSDKLSVVGQLAASVAHEIRNPLTSIKGFIQLFNDQIDEKYLKIMLDELNRIEVIITEFLYLAKPQLPNFRKNDICEIVRGTIAIIDSQAIMNNIQIKMDTVDDIYHVVCDEHKIKQVLINVLKNAIEAMPHGGTIYVRINKNEEQDSILIQVIDEGHGIAQERIPKLGEPFYSNKEKGTGLGLMVCFRIMEEHQGKIEVHSHLHQGTTVDILLPLKMEENRRRLKENA